MLDVKMLLTMESTEPEVLGQLVVLAAMAVRRRPVGLEWLEQLVPQLVAEVVRG